MERNTYQKQVVMETLAGCAGQHPTADTVFRAVKARIPSVSKATVYRILNQAVGQGLVRRVQIPAAADRYDGNAAPHYHLRCDGCGRVLDVDMPALTGLADMLPPASAYQITGYDIVFSGFCPNCRAPDPHSL